MASMDAFTKGCYSSFSPLVATFINSLTEALRFTTFSKHLLKKPQNGADHLPLDKEGGYESGMISFGFLSLDEYALLPEANSNREMPKDHTSLFNSTFPLNPSGAICHSVALLPLGRFVLRSTPYSLSFTTP